MVAFLEPFKRVGIFELGKHINNYFQREFSFEATPKDRYARKSYSMYNPEITIWVDEKEIIETIGCDEECIYMGRNIIGMDLQDFINLTNEKYYGEPDCLDFEEDSHIPQYVYEFEDIGLQVWTKEGKIVTVLVSVLDEESVREIKREIHIDNYFIEEILPNIDLLTKPKQIVFSAICCEKLEDAYKIFYEDSNWGKPDVLRKSIDFIYLSAYKSDDIDFKTVKELLGIPSTIVPDTDLFSSIYTPYAFDASCAVRETLEFLIDNDLEHIKRVATFCRNTVSLYIENFAQINPSNGDLKESNHPFMVAEYNRQNRLLDKLIRAEKISDGLIKELKLLNDNPHLIDLDSLIVQ